MYSGRIWFITICLLYTVSAISQVDSTFSDSVNEIIIYEYDTVYLASDTIRITDTIFDFIKPAKEKSIIVPSKNNSSFSGFLVPQSIGLSIATFRSGYFYDKILFDSIQPQSRNNLNYSFRLNYHFKKYNLLFEFGFCPFFEKYNYVQTIHASTINSSQLGTYDSLLITEKYTVNSQYNYLNFGIYFGRKWEILKRITLKPNVGSVVDFLLNYSKENSNLQAIEKQNFYFSLRINFEIIYKFNHRFELNLTPFHQRCIIQCDNHPYTYFQKTGISIGLSINL